MTDFHPGVPSCPCGKELQLSAVVASFRLHLQPSDVVLLQSLTCLWPDRVVEPAVEHWDDFNRTCERSHQACAPLCSSRTVPTELVHGTVSTNQALKVFHSGVLALPAAVVHDGHTTDNWQFEQQRGGEEAPGAAVAGIQCEECEVSRTAPHFPRFLPTPGRPRAAYL